MNTAVLKSKAPFLPADVAASVSRAVLHVRSAATALGSNHLNPDLSAVLVGCASLLASHLIKQAGQDRPAFACSFPEGYLPNEVDEIEELLADPTPRELLEESDHPAMRAYLAGIDAAKLLLAAIDETELIGGSLDMTCNAAIRGFIDKMPSEELGICSYHLGELDKPFWGCSDIPPLDATDAELLAIVLAEEGGGHD